MVRKVGLTGGIGSGKSTVAQAFEALGLAVYRADVRAKELMESDPRLAEELTSLLGPQAYRNGKPDRAWIASRVFADKELLAHMNAIIHPRVAEDWKAWATQQEKKQTCGQLRIINYQLSIIIMEAAILFESGFDRMVDYVVSVEAPEEQRVARAAARDGVSPEKIRARIANQMTDSERAARADFVIDNSDGVEVLPQILKLYDTLIHETRP